MAQKCFDIIAEESFSASQVVFCQGQGHHKEEIAQHQAEERPSATCMNGRLESNSNGLP